MIVFEILVAIGVPIELIDDEIEVAMFRFWHIFDQKRPGHFAPFDQRLIHPEHVRTPLRLVGAERARRVEDGRTDQPACAGLEPISL